MTNHCPPQVFNRVRDGNFSLEGIAPGWDLKDKTVRRLYLPYMYTCAGTTISGRKTGPYIYAPTTSTPPGLNPPKTRTAQVGVLGTGKIGEAFVRIMVGLGCRVLGCVAGLCVCV